MFWYDPVRPRVSLLEDETKPSLPRMGQSSSDVSFPKQLRLARETGAKFVEPNDTSVMGIAPVIIHVDSTIRVCGHKIYL